MQKISKKLSWKAVASLLLVSMVTSCATSSENTDSLPPLAESEAALLDDSAAAMPVVDDAAVFADLASAPEAASSDLQTIEVSAAVDEGSPFYNPIGGETLGRVAYTLYGSRKAAGELLKLNPNLNGVGSLSTDQKVYFDMDKLNPVPTHLTKDLLDRYPTQLAEKISRAGLSQETVTVGNGETLQEISQRLYGTTRYWTEIYLLNREAISNYDRVPSGIQLKVYQRGMVSVGGGNNAGADAKSTSDTFAETMAPETKMDSPSQQEAAEPVMPLADSSRPADAPSDLNSQTAAPMDAPPVADPIPETPTYTPPPVQEAPVVNNQLQNAPRQEMSASGGMFDFSNTANVRRIIYVVLILVIGIVAFVMTKSAKKKSFDMLDVTTDTTASGDRPKLGGDLDNHKNIG